MTRLIIHDQLSDEVKNWTFPEVCHASIDNTVLQPDKKTSDVAFQMPLNTVGHNDEIESLRQKTYQETKQFVEQKYEPLWQSKLQQVEKLLHHLQSPVKIIEQQLEEQIIHLISLIVQKLVSHELTLNTDKLLNVIQEAKTLLPVNQLPTRLSLHPEDIQLIESLLSKGEFSEVIADPNLSRGECKLVTETSTIDGTLTQRINNLVDRIFYDER